MRLISTRMAGWASRKLHHRDEALAPGEDLRVALMLVEQTDGFFHGRRDIGTQNSVDTSVRPLTRRSTPVPDA